MLESGKKAKLFLLSAVFLLSLVQESQADIGQGRCTDKQGASCDRIMGQNCALVPGCNYGTNGNCAVKSGYSWHCSTYPCENGICNACELKSNYFDCVNTVCFGGALGCQWIGNECEGTPICNQITDGSICTQAGCEWITTLACTLRENEQCNPEDLPPNCCKEQLACIDDGSGSAKCLPCIPQGSTTYCDRYGNTGPFCCRGLVCSPESSLCEPCHQIGDSCQRNSDCCNSLCENGICVACSSQGNPCSANSDCCAGHRCEDRPGPSKNTCVSCSSEGGYCSKNSDCCAGLSCNLATKTCAGPVCKREGESCASASCCQPPKVSKPLYCDSQNRNPPTCRYCAAEGEKCGPNLKCCSPLACGSSGRCEGQDNIQLCGTSTFNNVLFASGIAALATAILVALVYMAGEFFQNPKMITWSKIETAQLFVSIIAVSALFFVVSSFCSLNVGEVGAISSSLPYIFQSREQLNMYQAAQLYLEHIMGVGIRNMASIRFNFGAYELRTAFTTYECDAVCWLSLSSTNIGKYAGETLQLGITNNLLSTATVSYLTSAFQYFTLQYILNGLFLSLLPVAVVLRAVPFMRQFGGALIGIIVALYILYPLMLVFNAVMAPYLAKGSQAAIYDRDRTGCAGIDVFRDSAGNMNLLCIPTYRPGQSNYEWELGGYGVGRGERGIWERNLPHPGEFWQVLKANVLIFVTSVFLPAINFIVIAALARDLSRFLGEEADISRLGQMI